MAVQDFGSALLGGFQGAMALGQQRRENVFKQTELEQQNRRLGIAAEELELGERRLAENARQFDDALKRTDIELDQGQQRIDVSRRTVAVSEGQLAVSQDEDKRLQTTFNREQENLEIGDLTNVAGKQGFLSQNNPQLLDATALSAALAKGGPAVDRFALGVLNNGTLPRPEGFTYTAVNRDPRTGVLSIVGQYDNGEPGVLTEEGGSDPNENVVMLTPAQAANLLSDEWVNFNVIEGAKTNAGVLFRAYSNVNDSDLGVMEDQANLQARVVTTIDSQGDPAAAREFRRVLGSAESQEEKEEIVKQFAQEMGIEIPAAIDIRGELIDYTPDMQATYTGEYSMRASEANRATFGARRRRIEGYDSDIAELEASLANASPAQQRAIQDDINQKDAARGALIRDLNTTSLEAVGGEISDLTAKRDRAAAIRKPFWQGEIDKKMKVQKDLEESLGMRTPVMSTDAYKQLENQVIARVESMTPEEVDTAVDNGELSFSPEAIATMRQRLQEAGVSNIQDISKLPTREQLSTRALLAVIAPDQTARDAARQEMNNLKETGTLSMSALQVGDQRVKEGTLRVRIDELDRNLRNDKVATNASEQDRVDAASQLSADFIKETNAIFFGEDGASINLGEDEARQFARLILPQFLQRASTSRSEREARQYQSGLNTGVSLVMASYAAEETGGLGETFYSFFRPDAADSAGGTDFNLRNVEMVTDSNGNPLEFYYLNEQGARADQRISASDLQKLDKAVYNVVVDAAKRNAR
jgi:hypothetical protein